MGRLKLYLKLPEMGVVRIKLTVERDGRVSHVAILYTESEKNKAYVEKTIPTLTMPAFGDRFKNKNNHIFPITLSNE